MKAHIVIGKNFGDEGKGLATDCFAGLSKKNNQSQIAVRFNGGAQAGHTVDTPCGRFVFHELSSASFRRVDTYWAKDFLPDLYKLEEELNEFKGLTGFAPKIIASPLCRIVTIDDVLLNMALETARGKDRHGSCGMGIYEAVVRSEKHPLLLKDVKGLSAEKLFTIFKELRSEYYPKRLEDLIAEDSSLKATVGKENEFFELLKDENVLRNAAEEICRGAELVEIKTHDYLASFDEIIFEGAQGLLLDTNNTEFAPHITASHTGAKAAVDICSETGITDIEVCYVSRTYVTRHGAGVLPKEEEWARFNLNVKDATNIENPWQGRIRFAPHESVERFLEAVREDLSTINYPVKKSLFITHLNETRGKILFADDTDGSVDSFMRRTEITDLFDNEYLSDSPFSEEVKKY